MHTYTFPHTPTPPHPHTPTHTHTHTHVPSHTSPPTITLQIWEVSGADKRPLSQDQFGQFDSSKVYLVQYLHPPHSTLVVYVWVGGEVGEGGEKQLKAALKHAETVGSNAQKVHMKYAEFNFANRHFSYFFFYTIHQIVVLLSFGQNVW